MRRWLLMAFFGVVGMAALAAATVCVTAGCSTLGYYAHSVGGHLELLNSARPVPHWMSDQTAPSSGPATTGTASDAAPVGAEGSGRSVALMRDMGWGPVSGKRKRPKSFTPLGLGFVVAVVGV